MPPASTEVFDVAIIGFGPVGAALAALLGRRGRRVAVLDRSDTIYPLPRAFALDHEAMRLFQEIGIADALEPGMQRYRPTLYLGSDGQAIQHFDMGAAPYPLAWAPSYTFNQPALEAALRAAVGAMPGVQVRLGCTVEDVAATAEGASLSLRERDGTAGTLQARYVVACDGGTSPVRKRLGLRLRSLEFDEPWIVVDMHVDEAMLAQLPATNIQYCDPARPCTYVVGPGTHRRWEFLLLPHEAEQREMPEDAIWRLLARWLQPGQARIWRAATYRFHAVVLEQWRQGPVLLAGDAAHQMPPFLAQGMCQGLRDAANLAWKLDRVLTGSAPDSLLDSYGAERGPQVEEVTATVKRLGQIICERDPAQAAARDARLRAEQGGQVAVQLRQSLLPGIRHGLVCGAAPAGTPFPQPLVRRHGDVAPRKLDEAVPPGFLLVLRGGSDAADAVDTAQRAAWESALAALQARVLCFGEAPGTLSAPSVPDALPLREEQGVLAAWFARHACVAALVRPDHVVYGVADSTQAIAALLAHACRQMGLAAPQATAPAA